MKNNRLLLLSLLPLSLTSAQGLPIRVPPPPPSASPLQSPGILSLLDYDVEKDPSDPYRSVGFVEVIHKEKLQNCKNKNWEECETFEYSVPFIPEQNAYQLEADYEKAWHRFDARAWWRIQTAINVVSISTRSGPKNNPENQYCTTGVYDLPLNQLLIGTEFCDDLPELMEPCTYIPNDCYQVEWYTPINDCVQKQYDEAYQHALEEYYPLEKSASYWDDVFKSIETNKPYAIWWDGINPNVNIGPSGVTAAPVYASNENDQIRQQWIQSGQGKDQRAPQYFNQIEESTEPKDPNELSGERPGIPQLEEVKRETTTRANGIGEQDTQAGQGGQTPMPTQEKYGNAVWIESYAYQQTRNSEHIPPTFHASCMRGLSEIPRDDILEPVTYTQNWAFTWWVSTPEGYEIPNLKNAPQPPTPRPSNPVNLIPQVP